MTYQWRIQGGGGAAGAPRPLFSRKYYKKSPKLARIYKKILGAPFFQILDPPLRIPA